MPEAKETKPWFTASELAEVCGCTPDKIEALARSNHWPRVHGPSGSKIGVEVDAVRRALGSSGRTVHGSLPTSL